MNPYTFDDVKADFCENRISLELYFLMCQGERDWREAHPGEEG